MLIRTVLVTPFMQNTRVLIDEIAREALVVDPGGDIEKIAAHLVFRGEPVLARQILLTHAHLDHAGAVGRLQDLIAQTTGARPIVLAHRLDKDLRAQISNSAALFGLSRNEFQNAGEPDSYLEDGDEVRFGACVGKVLFTPGHSPGHISLYFETTAVTLEPWEAQAGELKLNCPVLIGGDLVFGGTIGRTDLPGGDGERLLRSIREKIIPLPDDTRILAGHGEDTLVGQEKRSNPFFR